MCKTIAEIQNGENPWFVKEMQTGYVILGWNQHFYGYSLFICKKHAVELFDLDKTFRTAFLQEKERSMQTKSIMSVSVTAMHICIGIFSRE